MSQRKESELANKTFFIGFRKETIKKAGEEQIVISNIVTIVEVKLVRDVLA